MNGESALHLPARKLRIAIVVHGRFLAFDLARELLAADHNVVVFTNYPKWATRRFGLPPHAVRSFWLHGVLARLCAWLGDLFRLPYLGEAWLHRWFGRWALGAVKKERWDVVHVFSGIAEELLLGLKGCGAKLQLMRGSAHILEQNRYLVEEERRCGVQIHKPSAWMMAREQREYGLADKIVVLSTFAYESFLKQGVPAEKLFRLPLAADVQAFRASREVIEERTRRILEGKQLRLLYVGAISYQKGMLDWARLSETLDSQRFAMRMVGPVTPEARRLVERLAGRVEIIGKVSHYDLPVQYGWADVFVFPTLHDGFAVVLSQAHAAGLPILATTNCGAPDIVKEGQTGWIVPVRSSEAMAQRLIWCDQHRCELVNMVHNTYHTSLVRTWKDAADDFVGCITSS